MEIKNQWKRPEVAEYLDKGPLHEHRAGLNMICLKVLELLLKLPEYTVLDVACGPGSVLGRMLHKHVPIKTKQYLGIDYSLPAIKRARHNFLNYKFKKMDVVENSIPSANIIVCADLLQHLANPEVAVENILNLLR